MDEARFHRQSPLAVYHVTVVSGISCYHSESFHAFLSAMREETSLKR
jgi:hypothetical protein